MTERLITDRHARNSSRPGDWISIKAEYICADDLLVNQLFPCSQTADHTFSGTTKDALRIDRDSPGTPEDVELFPE
jgi:hypothetical protein